MKVFVSHFENSKRHYDENLDFEPSLTFSSMTALMHPRTGGIVLPHSSISRAIESKDETSHFGVTTVAPCSRSSLTTSAAGPESGNPDLDGTIRFFAPLLTSHLRMDRPIPPSPPATRYVASASHDQVLWWIRYF